MGVGQHGVAGDMHVRITISSFSDEALLEGGTIGSLEGINLDFGNPTLFVKIKVLAED